MHLLGNYSGLDPVQDLVTEQYIRHNPAFKKFHLATVVLGSENLMKAIKYLYCHEVRISRRTHPEWSGAGEWG